jgi:hypothetical protein
MSLAVLARKSRTTNPRYRRDKCFILNMTGRGQVLGMSAKSHSGNCTNTKKPYYGKCSMGLRSGGCGGVGAVGANCMKGCGCLYSNGLSQPAPQMGYGVYLNRKSNAAYRPGGRVCCKTASKKGPVWKQVPNMASSEVIETRKLDALRCMVPQPVNANGKPVAKSVVCSGNQSCPSQRTRCGPPMVKPRLSYTRMNHWCGPTKSLCKARESSQQTALVKSRAHNSLCPLPCEEAAIVNISVDGQGIITLTKACLPLHRGQQYTFTVTSTGTVTFMYGVCTVAVVQSDGSSFKYVIPADNIYQNVYSLEVIATTGQDSTHLQIPVSKWTKGSLLKKPFNIHKCNTGISKICSQN